VRSQALSFIPEDMLMQLQGFHEEVAWNVKLPILLNMSACHLKLQDWEHAIQCCDQALDHDADNAKALFRRGCAKQSLGQTEAARKDLESAASRYKHHHGLVWCMVCVNAALCDAILSILWLCYAMQSAK